MAEATGLRNMVRLGTHTLPSVVLALQLLQFQTIAFTFCSFRIADSTTKSTPHAFLKLHCDIGFITLNSEVRKHLGYCFVSLPRCNRPNELCFVRWPVSDLVFFCNCATKKSLKDSQRPRGCLRNSQSEVVTMPALICADDYTSFSIHEPGSPSNPEFSWLCFQAFERFGWRPASWLTREPLCSAIPPFSQVMGVAQPPLVSGCSTMIYGTWAAVVGAQPFGDSRVSVLHKPSVMHVTVAALARTTPAVSDAASGCCLHGNIVSPSVFMVIQNRLFFG
jgi:hypothetical protein